MTRWLTESGDDRNMQLVEPFWFRDPDGKVWDAPEKSTVNGASIPRPLWTLIGSPYTGDYRRASIVHDVACECAHDGEEDRRAADRMFYHACRTGGCSVREATLLYLGVRIGATWSKVPQWLPAQVAAGRGPRVQRFVTEAHLEHDFQRMAEMLLAHPESDDPGVIEKRVDTAFRTVTSPTVQAP